MPNFTNAPEADLDNFEGAPSRTTDLLKRPTIQLVSFYGECWGVVHRSSRDSLILYKVLFTTSHVAPSVQHHGFKFSIPLFTKRFVWLVFNVTSTQIGYLENASCTRGGKTDQEVEDSEWLIDWCFNGTSTQKDQFVPTAGEGNRLSRLRIANEIQCIIPYATR